MSAEDESYTYLKLQTIINTVVMLMREKMFFDKRVDIWISLPEAIVVSQNAYFKRRLAKFNLNNFHAPYSCFYRYICFALNYFEDVSGCFYLPFH